MTYEVNFPLVPATWQAIWEGKGPAEFESSQELRFVFLTIVVVLFVMFFSENLLA